MDIQVIKIGSDGWWNRRGNLNYMRMRKKAQEIFDIAKKEGVYTILVISGAIKVEKIRRKDARKTEDIPVSDLVDYATLGQIELIKAAQRTFKNIYPVAQHLFTYDEVGNYKKRNGICDTLKKQLNHDIIPAINYSDSVDFDEIRKDNDQFAAHISVMLGAKRLVILGQYDGLYASVDDKKTLVEKVERIDKKIYTYCQSSSANGIGGFSTKVDAAKIATKKGVEVIIGNINHNLTSLIKGDVKRTYFTPETGAKR